MKRKFDSANRPPLLNQIPVSSSFFVSQNSEGCKISIESHTGLVKSTCERTFCGKSLGLDSEFNSIHFGIEINKSSKFYRPKKFLGPKIKEKFQTCHRFLDPKIFGSQKL